MTHTLIVIPTSSFLPSLSSLSPFPSSLSLFPFSWFSFPTLSTAISDFDTIWDWMGDEQAQQPENKDTFNVMISNSADLSRSPYSSNRLR